LHSCQPARPDDSQGFVSPALPVLLPPVRTDASTVALSWTAVVGRSYRVQAKTNLNDAGWDDLADVLPAVRPRVTRTSLPPTATVLSCDGFAVRPPPTGRTLKSCRLRCRFLSPAAAAALLKWRFRFCPCSWMAEMTTASSVFRAGDFLHPLRHVFFAVGVELLDFPLQLLAFPGVLSM